MRVLALTIGTLIGAAFLAYSNTLSAQFVYDDQRIIVANPLIRSLKNLPLIAGSSYWGMHLGQSQEEKGTLYRPLTIASYAFNYSLGGLNPRGYHLTNVMLHTVVTLLIWLLARRLGWSPAGAWAAGLVFAVLPVHTEAVTNIVGRAEVLAAFFILTAWLFVLRPQPSLARLTLGAASFLLALWSKENAAAFLGALVIIDVFRDASSWKTIVRKRWPVWTAFTVVFLLSLQWRYWMTGSALSAGSIPYFHEGQPFLVRMLTMARFIGEHYLPPLLAGSGFSADYTRPVLSDARVHDAGAWLWMIALTGVAIGSLSALFKTKQRAAWCALVFFIFLFPVSHVLLPLEVIGAERFLYVPSMGYALLVGLFFEKVWKKTGLARIGGALVLGGLCAFYAQRAIERNRVWHTEETLWAATLRDAPQSPRAWNGMGVILMGQKRYEEAIRHFDKAMTLNPMLVAADYNMATCFFHQGDLTRAKRGYLYVLQNKPADPGSLYHLGVIAEREKDYKSAADYYAALAQANPLDRTAEANLIRMKELMRRAGGVRP